MKHGNFLYKFAAFSSAACLLCFSAHAASEQFAVGKAGLVRFGEVVTEAGGTYTAPDGHKVPAVISYTDESGNLTNYIPVRQVAELFDAYISWDGENVILGKESGDVTISHDSAGPQWSETAEIGITAGPFTEIDPAEVDTSADSVAWLDGAEMRSNLGFVNQRFSCDPGNTVVVSVTNNGDHDQYFTIYRQPTVSYGEIESFSDVCIRPGKTMVRAFTLSEDADILTRDLTWSIDGGRMTDIVVSITEYDTVS